MTKQNALLEKQFPNTLFLILAGLLVYCLADKNLAWGLVQSLGFPEENMIMTVITGVFGALIAGIYVGIFRPDKGMLLGALMPIIFFILIMGFLFILIVVMAIGNGKFGSLNFGKFSDLNIGKEAWTNIRFIFLAYLAQTAVGGYGGYLGRGVKNSNLLDNDIFRFYVRFDWKLIFTAALLAECTRLVAMHLDVMWFHFLWMTLGNLYITITPSVWFSWNTAGANTFLMSMAFMALYFTIRLPEFIYKIFRNNHRHTVVKFLLAFLCYAAVASGTIVIFHVSKAPVYGLATEIADRGKLVWPVLLTREMKTVVYEHLSKYYEEKKDEAKAAKYKKAASDAYFRNGTYLYNAKLSYPEAQESLETALELDPENQKAMNFYERIVHEGNHEETS